MESGKNRDLDMEFQLTAPGIAHSDHIWGEETPVPESGLHIAKNKQKEYCLPISSYGGSHDYSIRYRPTIRSLGTLSRLS
jgi:hypothetical protein